MDWEMEITERKRTGLAFCCRRNPAGGREGQSYEKMERVPPLAGKRESPLSVFPLLRFFRAGGAMAGCLFFGRADKIGEGFVPAG